jgi:hypothetical protein
LSYLEKNRRKKKASALKVRRKGQKVREESRRLALEGNRERSLKEDKANQTNEERTIRMKEVLIND